MSVSSISSSVIPTMISTPSSVPATAPSPLATGVGGLADGDQGGNKSQVSPISASPASSSSSGVQAALTALQAGG